MCDITRQSSFDFQHFSSEIASNTHSVHTAVLINKCDLNTDENWIEKVKHLALENGFTDCFEVSALEDTGIEDAFASLAQKYISSVLQRKESYKLK